ncbi:MAG TPA: M48 family metalloprotease [Puia sp.]|nr:M48 family metalloprotease [Puia sp.]
MSLSKPFWLVLCLLIPVLAMAQPSSLYTYQDLSHFYYARQKDSLKKAWDCPEVFKEKAAQKKYKEIWDGRTDRVTNYIADDAYVHDKEVGDYVQGIVDQLVASNRQLLPAGPLVMLDRDPSVNAYAVGGNFLAVDLGLIAWSKTREELAFALAHELSHNILKHWETSAYETAKWLSSDEYKQSLNSVLDSKYERLTRLRKVMETYTFSRTRHQRYHESDADSLAIILMRNSHLAFSPSFFLRLDSADMEYRQPLRHPLAAYFAAYQLPFEEAWTQKRSHGLSTRSYNFSESGNLEDSLKTHPDCLVRYEKTKQWATPNPGFTAVPRNIHDIANRMLIWNMYNSGTVTACLYRILLVKDEGNVDPWYDFMVSNVFSALLFADHKLARFNAIGVMPKEYISKDYYGLQTMLEQMPRESLTAWTQGLQGQGFWKTLPQPEKELKPLFYAIALDPEDSDKNRKQAAKAFFAENGNSMYCEFAHVFEK